MRNWFFGSDRSDARDDVSGEDWKQDSFRQVMNTLRARYYFARSTLTDAERLRKKDLIAEIERVFAAWNAQEAVGDDDDDVKRAEEPTPSPVPAPTSAP